MDNNDSQWTVTLAQGDLLYKFQRRVGLIPAHGLGLVRRALFWSLLAWLPTAAWAWLHGGLLPGEAGEPLLAHFGINTRLLITVPLFIIAEGTLHTTLTTLLPQLVRTGIVPPAERDKFRLALKKTSRLRDSVMPWVAIFALVASWFLLTTPVEPPHELVWTHGAPDDTGLGFGAWWYLYVGRTIFLVLLFAWAWRLALLFVLFKQIAGLALSLVPTHPDRCAGLGFMARMPFMFAPVVLGISAVLASGWAHQMIYHEVTIAALKVEIIAFVVVLPLIFVAPFITFLGLMLKTKKQALLDYGALIGQHGRLVKERWIDGKDIGEQPILDAAELGPIADTAAPYELISAMRPLPLNMSSLMPLIGAAALPMIILATVELPIKTVLKSILKVLV